ncbi:LptF/LptG family permease [Candidatus Pelagibacter sp. HIMB1485]|uniref:LptF/LptG family permease n=1 Tax=Candidatus Pelagibacter sp. HIMB1485 TaxID=3415415 RepID=UPI003F8471D3
MKKILFRKLLLDCIIFFLISLFATSTIIWIFQAVNFLDIIVEDGRDYFVYLKYSLLTFPKVVSKIVPFAIFFSFYYVINRYETNNELMIFWNFGVEKMQLVKFLISFSFILTAFQLLITIYLVPETQNLSRSLIRESNVDFIESFVKPKKFNDNINKLTIYAEEKLKNGDLKNIYIKKNENKNNFQITIAKTGEFEITQNSKKLILFDGQTINKKNNKITNFYFSKSDFNLSSVSTDTIKVDKLQETRTKKHLECIKKYFKKDLSFNNNQKNFINHNCSKDTLDNLFQELYKRLIVPFFIPVLILLSSYLVIFAKENKLYHKSRIFIFSMGLLLIILSETMLRFIKGDLLSNIKFTLVPVILFIILYMIFKIFIKINIGLKN